MAKARGDVRQMGLFIPDTDWKRLTALPTIPSGAIVAIDSETRDEGLNLGVGPGWVHNQGHLCGISFAWRGGEDYIPVNDPDTDNFPREQVDRWLKDLERRCRLVFQNATYDLGWTGLQPTQRIYDVHAEAVLLDENQFDYGLNSICRRLGIPGKDEVLLRETAAALGVDPKREMWKIPARFKARYAAQDARATLNAHEKHAPMIVGQALETAYKLECELIPHIRNMRARGIRVDTVAAEKLGEKYYKKRDEALAAMSRHLTTDHRRLATIDDVRSPQWLKWQYDEAGIKYPRNPLTESMRRQGKKEDEGNPRFDKDWLVRQNDPLSIGVREARRFHEAAEKFIHNYILSFAHMGRLHAEINQLRDAGEDGSKGTRSYRFSYGNPPLQQMVRPDPDRATKGHKDYVEGFVDIGTEIRSCFLPEEGEVFGAPDYSQQEYRWIVIKGCELKLDGAEEAAARYIDDEATDFHNMVRDMTGLTRKKAKDCNFAKAFGAGIPKFAEMTGMSLEEAKATMEQYDEKLPFVEQFAKKAKQVADRKGFVRLLGGYRARFDDWEPGWLEGHEWGRARAEGQKMNPCRWEEAEARTKDKNHVWYQKRLRRADTRIAGNRVIQGSAAVQTKMALLMQANEGMLPLLQMHDELGHSVSSHAYAKRIVEIMREVVQRNVPFKVDAEFGPTWGDCKRPYEPPTRLAADKKKTTSTVKASQAKTRARKQ